MDVNSNRTAGEYLVFYHRPFHRAPWFYWTLGGVALSFAGGFHARRAYRRNQLLKRRFNPYVAGAPILRDDMFFGRERLLDRVLQTIHNNSILLYGERRIGKTSFQHRLKQRLHKMNDPDYDFYPVYIDLQGTPQEHFFSHLAEEVFEELKPQLDGLKQGVANAESHYGYRDFVRDINGVLRVLKKKSSKQVKLALLIDEVDELNSYDPKINQSLRGLFMRSFAENLVAVVSGVAIKKQWESEGSPWYNFFEEVRVKPFREQDAHKLIESPIRGVFKLEKGVVDRIISVTDCKPYLIQKHCVALINRLHEQKRRTVTIADVDAIGRPKEA
jgi:hypothetical protein